MVKDVILNIKKNLKNNNIKNVKDVYKFSISVSFIFQTKMKLFDQKVKIFLKENMYYHKNVIHKTNQGKKIIKNLFLIIKKNPKKFINFNNYKKINIDRADLFVILLLV